MNFNLFEKNWTTSYSQKKIVNIFAFTVLAIRKEVKNKFIF